MKKTGLKLFLFLFFIAPIFSKNPSITIKNSIKATEIYTYNEYLSSSYLQGRLTGTKGFMKAAQFVKNRLKSFGLKPLFSGSYLQPFHVDYTKVYNSSFKVKLKSGEEIEGVYFKNYYPFGCSGSGEVEGDIVFAGMGITSENQTFNDYKDIDVKGKVVMILPGVPSKEYSKYRSYGYKIENAKKHGAKALIIVRGAIGVVSCKFAGNFPVISITKELANSILKEKNFTLKEVEKVLKLKKNISFKTEAKASIKVKSEGFKGKGYNIGAYIKGRDKRLKNQFIIIGAHLDHLGRWPLLIPGADDNASGSSTLLSISKALPKLKGKTKRSIAVIFFSGEEMGLLGSEHFLQNKPEIVKKINYMINMDMVGVGNKIFVLGLKNFKEFEKAFYKSKEELGIKIELKGNKIPLAMMRNGSDHAPFARIGIPSVSVFSSGSKHHGYHTKEDTIYWITPKIMEDIGEIVLLSAFKLSNI